MKKVDGAVVPFHSLIVSALTTGFLAITASPNSSLSQTRLVAAADEWAHFRIRRLRFRLHPALQSTGVVLAAGYVGGNQDTPPGTVAQVMELLPSCARQQQSTVPTEWVEVPKKDLAGPLPWYKSVAGGADATEESPGIMVFAGTGTDTVVVEFRGVLEFKTAVATGNTPLALELRARVRDERRLLEQQGERARLLAVLGSAATVATQGVRPCSMERRTGGA
jgi:hypothetical protein